MLDKIKQFRIYPYIINEYTVHFMLHPPEFTLDISHGLDILKKVGRKHGDFHKTNISIWYI